MEDNSEYPLLATPNFRLKGRREDFATLPNFRAKSLLHCCSISRHTLCNITDTTTPTTTTVLIVRIMIIIILILLLYVVALVPGGFTLKKKAVVLKFQRPKR